MRDKTKMFLSSNLVCLALILLSIYDKNGAEKPTTIQNNLAFATFPSTDTTKRYRFNEGGGNIN
ncbi:unnamed protein product [Meloidogyne enterolobii]|uniref:Uncharacterized protein n=1 Tax=Meloidogyne enterolobii TaxID=390850 RepID=A0ACB1AJG4_MELEN